FYPGLSESAVSNPRSSSSEKLERAGMVGWFNPSVPSPPGNRLSNLGGPAREIYLSRTSENSVPLDSQTRGHPSLEKGVIHLSTLIHKKKKGAKKKNLTLLQIGHFYFGKNRTFLFWLDTSCK